MPSSAEARQDAQQIEGVDTSKQQKKSNAGHCGNHDNIGGDAGS